MSSKRVLFTADGAKLIETSFLDHIDMINNAVAEAVLHLVDRPPIVVWNRECNQPRDVGFFSDVSRGYFYSSQVMEANKLTPALKDVLNMLNHTFKSDFNGLLVNRYRDGKDTVGAHSDSEAALDPESGVVAISWGATRKFRIRRKMSGKAGTIEYDAVARHGYAIQMWGERFQNDFTHEIVAEAGVHDERISITARRHMPDEEARLFKNFENAKKVRAIRETKKREREAAK